MVWRRNSPLVKDYYYGHYYFCVTALFGREIRRMDMEQTGALISSLYTLCADAADRRPTAVDVDAPAKRLRCVLLSLCSHQE